MRKSFIAVILATIALHLAAQDRLRAYVDVIQQHGKPPIEFVNQVLLEKDLVVFDDALHNADEPFRFYIDLVRDRKFQSMAPCVFIEVFSITSQPLLDRYFASPARDSTILLKVFQDDFSGYGWRYQSYLDLLSAIWEVNRQLPESGRIKVYGVDQPIYWEALHTRQDYEIFQQSLTGRDYFMYRIIAGHMGQFRSGKKGIFLTNTRHAYKGIRNAAGNYYWNATTFLHQHHPGKAFSARIHNVSLYIEKVREGVKGKTTEGLDRVSYKWVKMDGGRWDSAFAKAGNKPVAIPLSGNPFGQTSYTGNHMLDAHPGQTMQDAYDALIFLAPLGSLHFSARMDFFYTPDFKKELARRLRLLHGKELDELLQKEGVKDLDGYIKKITGYEPVRRNDLLQ